MVPKQLIWSDFPFLVECDSSAESGAGSGGGQRKARGAKRASSVDRNRGDLSRERNTYLSRKFAIALLLFSLWFSLLEERAGIGALHPGFKIHGCLVLQNFQLKIITMLLNNVVQNL